MRQLIIAMTCLFIIFGGSAVIWNIMDYKTEDQIDSDMPTLGIKPFDNFLKEQAKAHIDESNIPTVSIDLGLYEGIETVVPNFLEAFLFFERRSYNIKTSKGSFKTSKELDGLVKGSTVFAHGLGDNRVQPKICINENNCASLLTDIKHDEHGNLIDKKINKFVLFREQTIFYVICLMLLVFVGRFLLLGKV